LKKTRAARVAGKLIHMNAQACRNCKKYGMKHAFGMPFRCKVCNNISTVGLVLKEFEVKIIYGGACTKIKC
jgi:hypothetical protein